MIKDYKEQDQIKNSIFVYFVMNRRIEKKL